MSDAITRGDVSLFDDQSFTFAEGVADLSAVTRGPVETARVS